ncbi:MAG: class IV adenylate cyclase [Nanoarchaeota archaeon]|nr:class IV adenylate cyclase [Nanoarchaeota archaeon]
MFEIEVKIPLSEKEYTNLDRRLSKAAKGETVYEVNHKCDIFGFFRRTKRLLRIREETKNRKTRYILTFKGMVLDSEFRKRREIEREVSRFTAKLVLLLKTGFVYKKRRKNFKLMDSTVSLDYVEELGHFLEIESPDEKEIETIIRRLNIRTPPVKKTYYDLLQEKMNPSKKRGKNK